jgi:hypothetical protein
MRPACTGGIIKYTLKSSQEIKISRRSQNTQCQETPWPVSLLYNPFLLAQEGYKHPD